MFDGFLLNADGNVSFVPGNSSFPSDMSLRKVCAERANPEVYVAGCLAIISCSRVCGDHYQIRTVACNS